MGGLSPRPPAVQPVKPSPPQVATTPQAPQVAPAAAKKSIPPPAQSPTPGKRPANVPVVSAPERKEGASNGGEPLESGWDDDDATRLSSSALVPAATDATEVRNVPQVAPAAASPRPVSSSDLAPLARPASSPDVPSTGPRPRSSPDLKSEATTAPAPAVAATAAPTTASPIEDLPVEVQEQLFGVLRAALDASLVPLLEKQKELEARLETLKADKRTGASIPVSVGPSLAPAAPSIPPAASPSGAPKTASIVPTSYGFVIQPDAPVSRASIEVALENVGPIDMPDFGRGRRSAGRVLVGLLLAGLVAAIAATVLSYT